MKRLTQVGKSLWNTVRPGWLLGKLEKPISRQNTESSSLVSNQPTTSKTNITIGLKSEPINQNKNVLNDKVDKNDEEKQLDPITLDDIDWNTAEYAVFEDGTYNNKAAYNKGSLQSLLENSTGTSGKLLDPITRKPLKVEGDKVITKSHSEHLAEKASAIPTTPKRTLFSTRIIVKPTSTLSFKAMPVESMENKEARENKGKEKELADEKENFSDSGLHINVADIQERANKEREEAEKDPEKKRIYEEKIKEAERKLNEILGGKTKNATLTSQKSEPKFKTYENIDTQCDFFRHLEKQIDKNRMIEFTDNHDLSECKKALESRRARFFSNPQAAEHFGEKAVDHFFKAMETLHEGTEKRILGALSNVFFEGSSKMQSDKRLEDTLSSDIEKKQKDRAAYQMANRFAEIKRPPPV